MIRAGGGCGVSGSRMRTRLVLIAMALAGVCSGGIHSARSQTGEVPAPARRGMMPSVSLGAHMAAGADSIRQWYRTARPLSGDRSKLYQQVVRAFAQHRRFSDRVALQNYPKDQFEWLLITDTVADTLASRLHPILQSYGAKQPEEILTDGRQRLELEYARIPGPPSRMLGLHVNILGQWAISKADSLLASGVTQDRVALEDGVLRYIKEWCYLYNESHKDVIEVFESRKFQEDWIIGRLRDRCGNQGTWKLKEQYMAMVGWDSTTTPPTEVFAHEFHLEALKCEGDTRVIWVDLPNFEEVQLEAMRRAPAQRPPEPTPDQLPRR